MEARVLQQSSSYRRGVVLGLTMAEIMLLLVFCLLIAITAFLRLEHLKVKAAEKQLREAEAELYREQVEFREVQAQNKNSHTVSSIAQDPGFSELIKSWERAGEAGAVDEFWRELVEG